MVGSIVSSLVPPYRGCEWLMWAKKGECCYCDTEIKIE